MEDGLLTTDDHDITKRQYSKTCGKRPLSKRTKIDFQDQLSLSAGQKYCSFLIKIFVLSIFEWPFYTDFTVLVALLYLPLLVCGKYKDSFYVQLPDNCQLA